MKIITLDNLDDDFLLDVSTNKIFNDSIIVGTGIPLLTPPVILKKWLFFDTVVKKLTYFWNNTVWVNIAVTEGCTYLPVPNVVLGYNYVLPHSRGEDINTMMTNNYYSRIDNINTTGSDWANDVIRVGIQIPKIGNLSFLMNNKPMIFIELQDSSSRYKKKYNKKKTWLHPSNKGGDLNRSRSSYGNGSTFNDMTTEFDITSKNGEIISIDWKKLYDTPSVNTLPIKKVDMSLATMGNFILKKGQRIYRGQNTNIKQLVRFRFAIIDPTDSLQRSIILSPPSEPIVIYPKSGLFSDDYYYYDMQVTYA